MRRPQADLDSILLWTDNYKPDFMLLKDPYVLPWIRDYTLALCMRSLGEARSKFASLPGPQGGTTLNGDALLAKSVEMITQLEADLGNYVDGQTPMWFVIG
jgi:hypothetical protein